MYNGLKKVWCAFKFFFFFCYYSLCIGAYIFCAEVYEKPHIIYNMHALGSWSLFILSYTYDRAEDKQKENYIKKRKFFLLGYAWVYMLYSDSFV